MWWVKQQALTWSWTSLRLNQPLSASPTPFLLLPHPSHSPSPSRTPPNTGVPHGCTSAAAPPTEPEEHLYPQSRHVPPHPTHQLSKSSFTSSHDCIQWHGEWTCAQKSQTDTHSLHVRTHRCTHTCTRTVHACTRPTKHSSYTHVHIIK